MTSPTLERAKTLIDQLNDDDRHALARYLDELTTPTTEKSTTTTPPLAEQQLNIAWLKKHRGTYAGQYVALVDGRLVGSGCSQREAREQAVQQGVPAPLIMRVTSIDESLPGGL